MCKLRNLIFACGRKHIEHGEVSLLHYATEEIKKKNTFDFIFVKKSQ